MPDPADPLPDPEYSLDPKKVVQLLTDIATLAMDDHLNYESRLAAIQEACARAIGGEDDGQTALDFVQRLGLGMVPDV